MPSLDVIRIMFASCLHPVVGHGVRATVDCLAASPQADVEVAEDDADDPQETIHASGDLERPQLRVVIAIKDGRVAVMFKAVRYRFDYSALCMLRRKRAHNSSWNADKPTRKV